MRIKQANARAYRAAMDSYEPAGDEPIRRRTRVGVARVKTERRTDKWAGVRR
jgi:hypothetical protein